MTTKELATAIMQSPANKGVDWTQPKNQQRLFQAVLGAQQLLAPEEKTKLAQAAADLEARRVSTGEKREVETEKHNEAMETTAQQRADTADKRAAAAEAEARARDNLAERRLSFQEKSAEQRNNALLAAITGRKEAAADREHDRLADSAAKLGIPVGKGDTADDIRKKVAEAASKKDAPFDEDTIKYYSAAAIKDPTVLARIPIKSANGAANRSAVLKQIAVDNADNPGALAQGRVQMASNTAEAGVVGRQIGNTALGMEELKPFAEMVIAASDKVDRTQYKTVNALIEAAEARTGGENVITLGNNIAALKAAYTQILVRGGQSGEGARARADAVLDQAWSKGQIKAGIRALQAEGEQAFAAAKRVQGGLGANIGAKPPAAPPTSDISTKTFPEFAVPGKPVPTGKAIQTLRDSDTPETRKQYDAHFGEGAAAKALAQ
jgi:hypothetical protein